MASGMPFARPGPTRKKVAGGSLPAKLRSSRSAVHRYPIRALPKPGSRNRTVGLVEEQPFGGEDVPADGFTDRLQDPEALLQPTVEGCGADADAVAGQSLRQPVDRQVILELRRHGVGERGFRRHSVADQPVRRGRLRLLAAAGAAEHGTLDRDADVVGRNVVQPFSRLGANDLPLAAATRTDRLVGLEAAGDGRHFVADLPAAPGARGAAKLARPADARWLRGGIPVGGIPVGRIPGGILAVGAFRGLPARGKEAIVPQPVWALGIRLQRSLPGLGPEALRQ